jgi:hypothetical protein
LSLVECCVLSGSGFSDGPITRPEGAYRLGCVVRDEGPPPPPYRGLGPLRLSSHTEKNKRSYSFCLMVEASDRGYVLHTRRIHVTRYNVVSVGYILYRVTCIRLVCKTYP